MWTVNDVEEHKKGLTDRQKAQWVRIANNILKREMKKGALEKDAAAKAIKEASGVINTNKANEAFTVYKNKPLANYEPELVIHQTKPYLKVPVVMMVEGVHSGSMGPLLHTMEELGKFPASWNGIPVVINHPEEDGVSVSANSPDIIDKVAVGRVYNTNAKGKLKAEIWFDEDKLNEVSPQTLEDIQNSKAIEVSVGVYNDVIDEQGTWNDEEYIGIATNHRPDHLAVLPDSEGACSIEDGGGIGANSVDAGKKYRADNLRRILANASVEYKDLIGRAQDALRKLDKWSSGSNNDYAYYYLTEMYKDHIVYEKNSSAGTQYFKQDYEVSSLPSNKGEIILTGVPTEVKKEVTFVTMNTQEKVDDGSGKTNSQPSRTRTKFSINNQTETSMDIKEKVTALIANSQGRWTEADRPQLEAMSEAQLDKLAPVEKVVEKQIEVNKLTPEQQAALDFGTKQLKERREKMVAGINANAKGVWAPEKLAKMDMDILEGIYKSVVKEEEPDYSLQGVGSRHIQVNEGEEEEPLFDPNFNKEK